MNIFKKFFTNFSKKKEIEKPFAVNKDKITILSSVMARSPSNIDSKKVLKTLSSLVDNNKSGESNDLFIAMSKIKECYEFLEKMHDCEVYSAEWLNNYGKVINAINENAEEFNKQEKEGLEKLKEFLKKND